MTIEIFFNDNRNDFILTKKDIQSKYNVEILNLCT